ncbi:hypothetical protein RJT34_08067 [Clitoria ternatea]|uniref:PPM-type phosphatase domain-containing protein n=1 Tax=Clitoria ternatea TaxID=43366 RepID=A0AAN9K631_CLITE
MNYTEQQLTAAIVSDGLRPVLATKELVEAFLRKDEAFRKELDSYRKSIRCMQKDWHPGCTVIAALIVRKKLFVANIGDCKAILCRAGNPIALSKDKLCRVNTWQRAQPIIDAVVLLSEIRIDTEKMTTAQYKRQTFLLSWLQMLQLQEHLLPIHRN